jgi:hypothetical protein
MTGVTIRARTTGAIGTHKFTPGFREILNLYCFVLATIDCLVVLYLMVNFTTLYVMEIEK